MRIRSFGVGLAACVTLVGAARAQPTQHATSVEAARPIVLDVVFPRRADLATSMPVSLEGARSLRFSIDSVDTVDAHYGELAVVNDSSQRQLRAHAFVGSGSLEVDGVRLRLPADSVYTLTGRVDLQLDGVSVHFRRATVVAWSTVLRIYWERP
jgi:hypothetical protein